MSVTTWQDVRRVADDIELQIHLAGMETRDRWNDLKHQVADVEHRIGRAEGKIDDLVAHELVELRHALLQLRDEIYGRARGDFVTGW